MAHNFISNFNPVTGDFLFIHCTLCLAREGSERATAPCERAVQQQSAGKFPFKYKFKFNNHI
jgi:hypothetical protein